MTKKILLIVVLHSILFSAYSFGQQKNRHLYSVEQNGLCGYINKTGKIIIPPQFDTCWNFSERFAGVIVNGKLGFIDETGKFIAQPIFNYDLTYFSEGFAYIRFGNYREGTEQVGFVNSKGQITILPAATTVYSFSEGLAVFEKGGLHGYVDKNMNVVIEPQFKYAASFNDGLARVTDQNGKDFYIDRTGRKELDTDGSDFSEGLAFFEVKDKYLGSRYGFIDIKGNIVIKAQFRRADFFYEGLCAVQDEDTDKWGFIDKTGKFVIKPQFEEVERFSEGLAQVSINEKWGYINRKGQIVIPAEFEAVGDFENGIAAVKVDDDWNYYIDKKGKFIWKSPD